MFDSGENAQWSSVPGDEVPESDSRRRAGLGRGPFFNQIQLVLQLPYLGDGELWILREIFDTP
jgi:hypothetical protein